MEREHLVLPSADRAGESSAFAHADLVAVFVEATQPPKRGADRARYVDRAILHTLCHTFASRPVGLSTLAITVGEAPETVAEVYEPYLLQCGLIQRSPQGRAATPAAHAHLDKV